MEKSRKSQICNQKKSTKMKSFIVLCVVFICLIINISEIESKWTFPIPQEMHRSLRHRRSINTIRTINEVVDFCLRESRPTMLKYNLDPFKAPNQKQSLGLGTLILVNVKVFNLSTIKRADDIKILDYIDTRKLRITAQFIVDNVMIKTDYSASAFFITGFSGKLSVKVPDLMVNATIVIDYDKLNITLEAFKMVIYDKLLDIKFDDDSLSSSFFNLFSPLVGMGASNIIIFGVQFPIQVIIRDIFDSINKIIKELLVSFTAN